MAIFDRLKSIFGWGVKHVDVGLEEGVRVSYKSDLPPTWYERIVKIFKGK